MLDCLDYSKLLYKCRKGVLRNNIDPPRLGVAEPHGYRDSVKRSLNDVQITLKWRNLIGPNPSHPSPEASKSLQGRMYVGIVAMAMASGVERMTSPQICLLAPCRMTESMPKFLGIFVLH